MRYPMVKLLSGAVLEGGRTIVVAAELLPFGCRPWTTALRTNAPDETATKQLTNRQPIAFLINRKLLILIMVQKFVLTGSYKEVCS